MSYLIKMHMNPENNPRTDDILKIARISLITNVEGARLEEQERYRRSVSRMRIAQVLGVAILASAVSLTAGSLLTVEKLKETTTTQQIDLRNTQAELVRQQADSLVNVALTTQPMVLALRDMQKLQNQDRLLSEMIASVSQRRRSAAQIFPSSQRVSLHDGGQVALLSHLELQGQKLQTAQNQIAILLVQIARETAQRSEHLNRDPLALTATEIQQTHNCANDAIIASCNGPLHGISCYAFTPTDPRRAACEVVKPICISCNIR